MSKLKLNKETIEAILNGATKIVLPIDEKTNEGWYDFKVYGDDTTLMYTCPIEINQPYYVVEDFGIKYNYDLSGHNKYLISPPYEEEIICADNALFEIFKKQNKLEDADQMQPHQSRIPHIEFSNIEIIKESGLNNFKTLRDLKFIGNKKLRYEDWLKSQDITTENVFILDIGKVKIK